VSNVTVIPAKAGTQARSASVLRWRLQTSPSFQRKLEPILISGVVARVSEAHPGLGVTVPGCASLTRATGARTASANANEIARPHRGAPSPVNNFTVIPAQAGTQARGAW